MISRVLAQSYISQDAGSLISLVKNNIIWFKIVQLTNKVRRNWISKKSL